MFSNLKSAWESRCHNPIYDGHMSVTDELVKKGWGGKPMGASQRTFLLAGGLVLLKCKGSWGQCSHPLIVGILQNSNSVGRNIWNAKSGTGLSEPLLLILCDTQTS